MENSDFQRCKERNKILKLEKAETLVPKEIELADNDLNSSKESFLDNNYKWSIIQSYYSMFHTARALLYNKGYREKSHLCLIEAIRNLYVQEGILNFKFLEALQLGKSLRENADYYGDFSKQSADELMNVASEFLNEVKAVLFNC
ncbi:MAG: HEPN domain-containing protein [Candidatus Pacebacteria bacterium]|nr:HEPN domain-containing protein [Candidatus Paceibacterota bacterium]MDD2757526.1 HEPN domain-containing protein [Candidatus Paceibacterota bacterium]MDD3283909.1 HEPN domain-containing protein [Candidatus Paceibacterota bacterium]MDD3970145.1 HEPN domain-containing protein [Candidatus Paceibacterota bacterium]MDD4738163.1 HEPN domain-containing protein [Candidatus Paceibacterota bacterium]